MTDPRPIPHPTPDVPLRPFARPAVTPAPGDSAAATQLTPPFRQPTPAGAIATTEAAPRAADPPEAVEAVEGIEARADGREAYAAALERVAGWVRAGEIAFPDAGTTGDTAAALATVLAALLRRDAADGEPRAAREDAGDAERDER